MKHSKKYVAGVLSIMIAVAAFPITTHAGGKEGLNTTNSVTIDGTNYTISQTDQTIQVTAKEKGKTVDNCTAYLDQGYMVYKSERTSKPSSKISYVSWLDDAIKESSPSLSLMMATTASSSWIKDGKYVYYPTQTSIVPKVYKDHTAYYWYKNTGTGDEIRTLYLLKGMAVTQVVALIAALVSTVATCGMTAAEIFIVALVMGGGSSIFAGSVVSRTISPTVKVLATNYEAKFTDASGAGNGVILQGSKVTVSDPKSNYYNKVFYEKYCPQVSQNFSQLAYLHTFKGTSIRYPGLKYYVEL
jgi:hypothetical protein